MDPIFPLVTKLENKSSESKFAVFATGTNNLD